MRTMKGRCFPRNDNIISSLLFILIGALLGSPSVALSFDAHSRRQFLESSCKSPFVILLVASSNSNAASANMAGNSFSATSALFPSNMDLQQEPFVYNENWTGTNLKLLTLEEAAQKSVWPMGRWPDPILRRPAQEVDMIRDESQTRWLKQAGRLLAETARREGAVGLAAQQCGVDARMIYIERPHPMILINPHIVARSPEVQQKVWTEECLVLPPTFRATVLRDDWVEVVYDTLPTGQRKQKIRLQGEAARCVQHELDHDRGTLIVDHVDLEDLESDVMRDIEWVGHEERMRLAFERYEDAVTL